MSACSLTKNVPDGYYLLKKNKIKYVEKVDFEYDLDAILKQRPNQKTLGILLKLRVYNLIDSAKIVAKKNERYARFQKGLEKKQKRYDKTNQKRIARAQRKGQKQYRKKILSDTIYNHLLLRERLKYKFGEEPIVFDSIAYKKTNQQIINFLRRKGYYKASLSDSIQLDTAKQTLQVTYTLEIGPVFMIDTVFYSGDSVMVLNHDTYLKKRIQNDKSHPILDRPFDIDILADYREGFAKNQRNSGFYKY